jgi:hypothetical protein
MRRERYHELDDPIRSCGSIGSQKRFVPTSLIDKERPLAECQYRTSTTCHVRQREIMIATVAALVPHFIIMFRSTNLSLHNE